MKNFLMMAAVTLGLGLIVVAAKSSEDITVASPSVQLFAPVTSVDSATARYYTWDNNALKAGTGYFLIDYAKAVTDSAATLYITVEQSAQTAPLQGVTQRWYSTDTIAVLSGKAATPTIRYKDAYSFALAGREVRLKVFSTDNHNLSQGKVDFLYKPDF